MATGKYRIVAKAIAFMAASIGAYAAILAIAQYYESHTEFNLSGEWILKLNINETTFNPYKGMNVGYKIYLTQEGHAVSGKGEKWWVNEEDLPYSQHDTIEMSGIVQKEIVPLTFELHGLKRKTVGIFQLNIENGGNTLVGSFSTTGANASGSVEAQRVIH